MLRSVFINLIAVFVDFDVCSTSRIYLYTRETYFRIFNPNIISRNLFGFIHQLFSPYWSIYIVRYACSLPLLKQSVHCAPNYILNIQRIAFENVSRILGNSCETMVNWKYTGERRILLVKAGNEIRSTESAKHRQSCVCWEVKIMEIFNSKFKNQRRQRKIY